MFFFAIISCSSLNNYELLMKKVEKINCFLDGYNRGFNEPKCILLDLKQELKNWEDEIDKKKLMKLKNQFIRAYYNYFDWEYQQGVKDLTQFIKCFKKLN